MFYTVFKRYIKQPTIPTYNCTLVPILLFQYDNNNSNLNEERNWLLIKILDFCFKLHFHEHLDSL